MKIGILTYHQSVNNGAVMQAYALSKRLQQEHPDATVEIIDYRMKKIAESYSYSLRAHLGGSSAIVKLKKMSKLFLDPFYLRRLKKRTAIFEACLPMLPLSAKTVISDDCNELIEWINDEYDLLIVGSDAIWNYIARGLPNAYLPDGCIKCKKMSYAASCYGMDFQMRSEKERQYIGECLNKFAFLGVRDGATEQFVRWSGCQITPTHTCDPTAFLSVQDLPIDKKALRQKLSARGFDFNKPAIGVMGTKSLLRMIRTFYKNEYQLVALYNHIPGADVQLYDLTPYEWAYVFQYFKLTFTTYFHGTMLSLRNGVPLICVALDTEFSKKHTPKTLDLLQRLGLADWYFHTDYISENFEQIKKKADELLTKNFHNTIVRAMDEEANSFDAFNQSLKDILEELKT